MNKDISIFIGVVIGLISISFFYLNLNSLGTIVFFIGLLFIIMTGESNG
jgi:hypothetical protein